MSQLEDFPPCNPEWADLDWHCGPCGLTRDSLPLEEANFDSALQQLGAVDPLGYDYEIIRWNHWACGWVEEIFSRPNSAAHEVAIALRNQLDIYPCLDEELLAEYEAEREALHDVED